MLAISRSVSLSGGTGMCCVKPNGSRWTTSPLSVPSAIA